MDSYTFIMRLVDWAKQQGIAYRTAWRWFHSGTLPAPARQTSTGRILVEDRPITRQETAALYARVSSHDQRRDGERQLERLCRFADAANLPVGAEVMEVGSGLNGRRVKLLKLLADPKITILVVEHKDRLARFGAEHLEAALKAAGRKLIVVDPEEMKNDLVQDMVAVLTSFCARLYGHRSAKNRAKRALEAAAR